MADYTITNMEDVEDAAVGFGLSPALEARFPRELGLTRSGVSLQRLTPNARVPFGHRHHEQEELYVVVEGGGRVALDDEVVDVRRWDAVRVAPGTMRCFEAGPDGLGYLAFGAPSFGPEDSEITQSWWPGG